MARPRPVPPPVIRMRLPLSRSGWNIRSPARLKYEPIKIAQAEQLSWDDRRHISLQTLHSNSPERLAVKHTIALVIAIAILMPATHAQQNAPGSSATAQALMSFENKWAA